jgi:predicted ATPase
MIRMAQEVNHPPNLAFPLIFCAMIHQFRREPLPTQERAEAAIALSREHGIPQFVAWGLTWQGWAIAQQGRTQEGILQIQRSLEAHATMRFFLNRPHILFLFAEVLAKEGRLAEALATVDEALEIVRTAGTDYYEAELYRLKGELTLMQSEPAVKSAFAGAEAFFLRAITIARQQSAKCFELRAATALSSLWHRSGNNEAALKLLAPIYESLTEGFDTPDMTDAKAMLEELS